MTEGEWSPESLRLSRNRLWTKIHEVTGIFSMNFRDLCMRVITKTLMALTLAAADFRRGYTAVRKGELNGSCWIFSLEIHWVKSHLKKIETGQLLKSTQLECFPPSKYKYTPEVSLIISVGTSKTQWLWGT